MTSSKMIYAYMHSTKTLTKQKMQTSYLLHRQEHDNIPGAKPRKIWNETIVEGQQSLIAKCFPKAVQDSFVHASLVTCITSVHLSE